MVKGMPTMLSRVRALLVEIKAAAIAVLASVDIATDQCTDRSRWLTSAARDEAVCGGVEGVAGGCVLVLPRASTGRLECAVLGRAEVGGSGEVELGIKGIRSAVGCSVALLPYDVVGRLERGGISAQGPEDVAVHFAVVILPSVVHSFRLSTKRGKLVFFECGKGKKIESKNESRQERWVQFWFVSFS